MQGNDYDGYCRLEDVGVKKEQTSTPIQPGDRLRLVGASAEYVFAEVDPRGCKLINITEGQRWNDIFYCPTTTTLEEINTKERCKFEKVVKA